MQVVPNGQANREPQRLPSLCLWLAGRGSIGCVLFIGVSRQGTWQCGGNAGLVDRCAAAALAGSRPRHVCRCPTGVPGLAARPGTTTQRPAWGTMTICCAPSGQQACNLAQHRPSSTVPQVGGEGAKMHTMGHEEGGHTLGQHLLNIPAYHSCALQALQDAAFRHQLQVLHPGERAAQQLRCMCVFQTLPSAHSARSRGPRPCCCAS